MNPPRWTSAAVAFAIVASAFVIAGPANASPQRATVGFAVSSFTAQETNVDTGVDLVIKLGRPLSKNTVVKWSSEPVSGNPRPGIDYTPTQGTATVAAGQTTGVVHLTVKGDTTVEPTQVVQLRLGAVTSRNAVADRNSRTTQLTILDGSTSPPAITMYHCNTSGALWVQWNSVPGAVVYNVTWTNYLFNQTFTHTVPQVVPAGSMTDDMGNPVFNAIGWQVTVAPQPNQSGLPPAHTQTVTETTCNT
jgi:hypothetical protein